MQQRALRLGPEFELSKLTEALPKMPVEIPK